MTPPRLESGRHFTVADHRPEPPDTFRYPAEFAEAQSSGTAAGRLAGLSQHPSWWVRWAALENPNTSDDAVFAMVEDPRNKENIPWSVGFRGRPALESRLAEWPDAAVRSDLAAAYRGLMEGGLLRETQLTLSRDSSAEVRTFTAATTTYRDILESLMLDLNEKVRSECADNPRIDREQIGRLLNDRRAAVRASAIFYGRVYPDAEQLRTAASDKSATVRWNVIFNPRSPQDAIELIANSDDELNSHHARVRLKEEKDGMNPTAPRQET
jgi:hypothetical protein